jgi:hypothetical protein
MTNSNKEAAASILNEDEINQANMPKVMENYLILDRLNQKQRQKQELIKLKKQQEELEAKEIQQDDQNYGDHQNSKSNSRKPTNLFSSFNSMLNSHYSLSTNNLNMLALNNSNIGNNLANVNKSNSLANKLVPVNANYLNLNAPIANSNSFINKPLVNASTNASISNINQINLFSDNNNYNRNDNNDLIDNKSNINNNKIIRNNVARTFHQNQLTQQTSNANLQPSSSSQFDFQYHLPPSNQFVIKPNTQQMSLFDTYSNIPRRMQGYEFSSSPNILNKLNLDINSQPKIINSRIVNINVSSFYFIL